jgi:hypothetical protein
MTPDRGALIPYLEQREGWTFAYSGKPETHDCARFCDGGVMAIFGVSPLKRFTSEWTTRRGARRVLARHGGMAAAVSKVMTAIDPVAARRGDVGMTEQGELVLFEGDLVVGLTDTQGYRRRPRATAVKAWTI